MVVRKKNAEAKVRTSEGVRSSGRLAFLRVKIYLTGFAETHNDRQSQLEARVSRGTGDSVKQQKETKRFGDVR